MKKLVLAAAVCLLSACASTQNQQSTTDQFNGEKLRQVLAAQDDANKARNDARHPYETLEFMQVAPGMTVVELLPGEGWYSQILVPYLGDDGTLIGLDYPLTMWPNFPFGTDEFIAERKGWPQSWPQQAQAWGGENAAEVKAFTIDTVPEALNGTADRVLFIRAMHNLARFEPDGQYLTEALQQTYDLLKPGGLVGVVQHEAPDARSDQWADGSRGYLKQDAVKQAMLDAGFEFVAASDINKNPKDQPGEEDIVWRLPPSYYSSQDNTAQRKKYEAIGESNRMTLLFRKPE